MTSIAAPSVFAYMAAASVASALLAVTRRNPVHSMLWVLALFLHVAGIFLLLNAEFLAVVQIVVYAGAILVFYLFVLMLLDLPGEVARPRFGRHWPFALAAGLSFGALAWLAWLSWSRTPSAEQTAVANEAGGIAAEGAAQGSLPDVGRALFGPFMLPFEIASLVLLAAIIGAVVLARRRTAEP